MRTLTACLLCLTLAACDDGANPTDAALPVDAAGLGPDARVPGRDAVLPPPSRDAGAPEADAEPDAAPLGPPPATLGGERPAALRVPDDYDPAQAYPLVVLLGGYWNLAADLDAWLGTSEYVDDLGFVLLLPDGLIDSEGAPFWHATDTCCDFDGRGVDDVAYLTGLIAEAKARVRVDAGRVILIGHSNGGFMAYRMACDLADQITSVVSLAGAGWLDASRCAPTRPVSVLHVHGTLDDVMPYGGDDVGPGAETMFGRWAGRDACGPGGRVEGAAPLELIDDDHPDETTESVWTDCQEGTDVRLWRLDGSDHYPEFRWAFTERVLDWALSHPRP